MMAATPAISTTSKLKSADIRRPSPATSVEHRVALLEVGCHTIGRDWPSVVWPNRQAIALPVYFFRIESGHYSGMADGIDLVDHAIAWDEMTKVCGDLVGGISRKMKQNSEWSMELLDEAKKPVFRIRLVAETL
jgi:hypothetical protein